MAMLVHPSALESWELAFKTLFATRRIQDLIGHLELLRVELCPQELDSNASVGFTRPTAFSHSQAPFLGSVTAPTSNQEAEILEPPQPPVGGEETDLQKLQSKLLEFRNRGDKVDPEIAKTLHDLGVVCRDSGDLEEAKKYLEESLRMNRSLYGGKDRLEIAHTLKELYAACCDSGDHEQALKHGEECNRMFRSLQLSRDPRDICTTLHELGDMVSQDTPDSRKRPEDFRQEKKDLEESLQMHRSLHGDRDHRDILETLFELGKTSRYVGDFEHAKKYLEEFMRMNRSLNGDTDRNSIAALEELGFVSRDSGELEEAKKHFEESLGMHCSLENKEDTLPMAQAMYELGLICRDSGDLHSAIKHIQESFRIKHMKLDTLRKKLNFSEMT